MSQMETQYFLGTVFIFIMQQIHCDPSLNNTSVWLYSLRKIKREGVEIILESTWHTNV